MPAFEAALDAGYGIELDVHTSSDGRLIVMHDADLVRMTGTDGRIATMAAREMARLPLLGTDATVPLLDDVLDLVAGRAPVLIEIKPGTPAARVGLAVTALLRDYSGPVAVQSFDPRVVGWFRREQPHVLRGQIAESFVEQKMPWAQKVLLRSMVLNAVTRPHFLAFDVESMPSGVVSWWRRKLGVPLLLWTVRTERQCDSALRYGANVIFEGVRPRVSV